MYNTENNPTASVTTLVNHQPHTQLLISKPNTILNNTLLLNGTPRYTISTTDPAGSKTNIVDARTKEVVVRINRRVLFADEVVFVNHGGKTMKIGKEYLKEVKMTDNSGRVRWNVDTPEGKFAWRMDAVHRLVLCPDTDMESPTAWVQLPAVDGLEATTSGVEDIKDASLNGGTGASKDYALYVPASEAMWDIIIGGWVILEQNLRLGEKEGQRAQGMGTAHAAYASSMVLNGMNHGGGF